LQSTEHKKWHQAKIDELKEIEELEKRIKAKTAKDEALAEK